MCSISIERLMYETRRKFMDKLSKEQRSWNMSRMRSKDTKPERIERSYLYASGVRYRCSPKDVIGKPDICIKRYHLALFVHGCFWHGHSNCKHFRVPNTNSDFWERKISRNIRRDIEVKTELLRLGYTVYQIWECELKTNQFSKLDAFILDYQRKRQISDLSSY